MEDKTISWKCDGCDGKFTKYCKVTLSGAVADGMCSPGDIDFPDCPYRDTNPKWEEIANHDSPPEDTTA